MWTVLVLFYAVATPILLVWMVFVTIPEAMHTRYRHRLWQIRDAIVDDVIRGDLTLSPATQRLLRSLYGRIESASRHTLRDGVIALWTMRRVLPPEHVDDVILGGTGASPRERERLAEYLAQFRHVSALHMLNGSPSGWVGGVILRILSSLGLLRRLRVEDAAGLEIAESAVRAERGGYSPLGRRTVTAQR